MAVTELGNQIDKQFSFYTEAFIVFLQAQYLRCVQTYLNTDNIQSQQTLLINAWNIKQTYEPKYNSAYQKYLGMSHLAETGVNDFIPVLQPKQLEYKDFAASVMKNGPQSVAKKAILYGVEPSEISPLELQKSFMNFASVATQKTVEAPRDNAMEAIKKDKRAIGNARFPNGDACDFCMMLASKGPVFSSEKVGFAAHRACKCMGRAVYEGYVNSPLVQERTDKWLENKAGKYTASMNRKGNKKEVDAGIRYEKTENWIDKYGKSHERTTYPLTEKGKIMKEADRIKESEEYARFKYKKADVPSKPKNLDRADELKLKAQLKKPVKLPKEKLDYQDYRPGIFGDY
jgi:hypothetical protein